MNSKIKDENLKKLSYFCAGITLAISFFAVISWHLGLNFLFKFNETDHPIPYFVALILILSSIALFTIYHSLSLSRILGGLIGLMGVWNLTDREEGFLQYIHQTILPSERFFPPSKSASFGFILLGTLLILWPRKLTSFQSFISQFLSLLVFIIGLLGIHSFILNTRTPLFDGLLINFYSTLGLFLLGIGFFIAEMHHERMEGRKYYPWLPYISGISIAIFVSLLTTMISIDYHSSKIGHILKLNNRLLFLILLSGFILSGIIGALIYLIQEYIKQNQTLEETFFAVDAAEAGTWNWNLKSGALNWNKKEFELFGVDQKNWIGTIDHFIKTFHPVEDPTLSKTINEFIKGISSGYTHQIIFPSGKKRYISSRGGAVFDEKKEVTHLLGLSWDITEFMKYEYLLKASESSTKIFNDSDTFEEAVQKLFHLFKQYDHWEVFEVWLLNDEGGLKLRSFVCASKEDFSIFEEATKKLKVEKETELLGQIWAHFRPSWYKNIQTSTHFRRIEAAKKVGIQGALAFPIFQGNQIIGVGAFYKRKPFIADLDEGDLNLLTSLGINFGHFIERLRSIEKNKDIAAIINFTTEAIFRFSTNGIVETWNKGAENIYGWKAKEIIGKHLTLLYPEDKLHEFDEFVQKLSAGENVERYQTQRKRKDGKIIWVDICFAPVKDEAGNIIAASEVLHDITKQREALSALQKSEEKYRDFVESTQDWIWEICNRFTFSYSNPAIKKILGFEKEEMLGKEIFAFLNDGAGSLKTFLEQKVEKKEGWSNKTLLYKHKDGSLRWLEGSANPIFNENGNVIGFRGVDRDVTERKNIEKLKNGFISVVSHELRTPLTSIHGSLGILLKDPSLSEKHKNLLEIAFRNSLRLTTLIGDILDIQKIEAGSLDLDLKPMSLKKVIREAVISIEGFAEKHKVNVIEENPEGDVTVRGDYDRLIQVLLNLLSNGIKFSPPGGSVYISHQVIGKMARVSVRDQGEGIPEEFHEKIFTKFAQANVSNTRKEGGTGLGLSICKNLIEKMGGHIDFMTKKGQGSTFYFDIPIQEQ